MRQNALPVLCRKRRETSGISSQVSRSPAWTTEEEEAARSIMVFGLSLVKLVVGFGPPKKGSFLVWKGNETPKISGKSGLVNIISFGQMDWAWAVGSIALLELFGEGTYWVSVDQTL